MAELGWYLPSDLLEEIDNLESPKKRRRTNDYNEENWYKNALDEIGYNYKIVNEWSWKKNYFFINKGMVNEGKPVFFFIQEGDKLYSKTGFINDYDSWNLFNVVNKNKQNVRYVNIYIEQDSKYVLIIFHKILQKICAYNSNDLDRLKTIIQRNKNNINILHLFNVKDIQLYGIDTYDY